MFESKIKKVTQRIVTSKVHIFNNAVNKQKQAE